MPTWTGPTQEEKCLISVFSYKSLMDITEFMQTNIIVTSRSIEKLALSKKSEHGYWDFLVVWLRVNDFSRRLSAQIRKGGHHTGSPSKMLQNIPFLLSYPSSSHLLMDHFLKKKNKIIIKQ